MSDAPTTVSRPDPADGARRSRRQRLAGRARGRRGGFARSRFVSTMKYLLPGLAFALLVLIAVWPKLVSEEDRFRLDAAVGPLGSSKPQVINPRVLGVDSADRPFEISADMGTRTESGDGLDLYLLDHPKADIILTDGSWVAVTARDGRYELDTKILHLAGDVDLFHDDGYEFRTQTARVDLASRDASGSDPVQGQGPFGLLNSQGFQVLDGGQRVIFTGRATMTVYRDSVTGGAPMDEREGGVREGGTR